MRLLATSLWVFGMLVSLVACSEVITPSAPLILNVWSSDEGSRGPLEGVQLCETDTKNCAVSNENGEVTIKLPFDREVSYTLQKEGYESYLLADDIPADGVERQFGMATAQATANEFESLMSPYPQIGTGRILLGFSPPIAGATFDLIAATGTAYYTNDDQTFSLDLPHTTSSGRGGFVEVPPGEFQVELGGTANNCSPYTSGWPGDAENSIRIRVREAHTSFANMRCPLPPFSGSALFHVTEFQGFGNPTTPLEGVEICETDTTNCVLTGADGLATLELPIDEEVSFTWTKGGYFPYLHADVSDAAFQSETRTFKMWSDEAVADLFESVMSPYPQLDTGGIEVVLNPAREGVTFTLVGATGKAYYLDEEGTNWSLDLTATTARGWGGFVEVSPGELEIEFGGTASGCVPRRAWPSDAENRIRVPVRAGYFTLASVTCP